jgi:hypothetical protein
VSFNRREWLAATARSLFISSALPRLVVGQDDGPTLVERRIATVIRDYEAQGFHRTGTSVDNASGDWLCEQVRKAGLSPTQESFPLDRVDLRENILIVGERRIEGVPLFDGAFTDPQGVRGRFGGLETSSEIGLTDVSVNTASAGPLGEARRASRHRAIVAVTRGRRPGLCPSNADLFLRPFGPPVLQVSSQEAAWLGEEVRHGPEVQLIAHVARTSASAFNVVASIEGNGSNRSPLVVMTPRSGWFSCASERGGGIACWLEVMRALGTTRLGRPVVFVASSGHELGHLGVSAFISRRAGVVTNAVGWLHLGANIGAATDPSNTVQASDDEFEARLASAMAASGLGIDRRNPRGTIPSGEAEAVHRGGGRYVSIIGGNALFHNPADRGPQAVNPAVIRKFSTTFIIVARAMAGAA